ncbi:MFS general substrate transporter [Rhodotorula diobovata]|uniref:MFS general substrate transporter n=1 Tax=Rhodotorula diobovata TaxID=5288 RepID=A0A5C5FWA8_9BASI|nr:MFS general substrate transporter [Rhodotorula diobovata]
MAERRLVRKVDMLLMPVLLCSAGLQYYDKAVLGSAAIFGIIKDLGLSTTHIDPETGKAVVSTLRYSTASSAFYWGYIVAVLPFALLLQRFPLAKTLSACIFLWGVTALLTIVCTSYEGLVVQRIFLGVLESSISPGFVLITSQWYKKSEQAARLGIWYSATGIFSAFSGIVNYGLGSASGSFAPWKRMYCFAGGLTILFSLIVLVVVPDSPRTSQRWFNDDERQILIRRSRENMSGRVELGGFKWRQAKEAALDVKIWLFMIMGAGIYVCNGAVTAFASQIVKSFGYSSLTTIAISMCFTAVFIYFFTWLSSKWKNGLTILLPISCLPVIVGATIIYCASWERRGVPLFGSFLLATFGSPYVLLLALSTSNVSGSTKKSISAGAIFVGYCVGNIIGPYTVFIDERAVKYRSTWIALYAALGGVCLCSLALRFVLARENARRDARDAASADVTPGGEKHDGDSVALSAEERDKEYERVEREDLTDMENRAFRYTL